MCRGLGWCGGPGAGCAPFWAIASDRSVQAYESIVKPAEQELEELLSDMSVSGHRQLLQQAQIQAKKICQGLWLLRLWNPSLPAST